jgi:hypothetical protein
VADLRDRGAAPPSSGGCGRPSRSASGGRSPFPRPKSRRCVSGTSRARMAGCGSRRSRSEAVRQGLSNRCRRRWPRQPH